MPTEPDGFPIPRSLNVLHEGGLSKATTLMALRPVKISTARDAKRLAARLIHGFQEQTITSQDAKDLMYLIISYIQIVRQTEIEDRLNALEKGGCR